MKIQPKLLAVLTSAALLAGCASGGGSGSAGPRSGTPSIDPALAPLRPGYEPSPCGTLYGYPVECQPYLPFDGSKSGSRPAITNVVFRNWAEINRDPNTLNGGAGVSEGVVYQTANDFPRHGGYQSFVDRQILSVSGPYSSENDATVFFQITPDGKPGALHVAGYAFVAPYVFSSTTLPGIENLSAIGEPAFHIGRTQRPDQGIQSQSPFVSVGVATGHLAVISNPYLSGWEYQSFGVWNNNGGYGKEFIVAASYGAATPASAVPTSGTATFNGKLAGLYISPTGQGSTALAAVRVDANFSTRSLGFTTSDTVTTRDLQSAAATPNLNLNGTLTYLPSANSFAGTLTNAGGTMTGTSRGKFYGPTTQELGGVFTVKSPTTVETFTGAYGAKR